MNNEADIDGIQRPARYYFCRSPGNGYPYIFLLNNKRIGDSCGSLYSSARFYFAATGVAKGEMTFAVYSFYLVYSFCNRRICLLLSAESSGTMFQPRSLMILRRHIKKMLKKLKTMKYNILKRGICGDIDKAYNRAENSARHLLANVC